MANLLVEDFRASYVADRSSPSGRSLGVRYMMGAFKGDRTGELDHERDAIPKPHPCFDHLGNYTIENPIKFVYNTKLQLEYSDYLIFNIIFVRNDD